MLSNGLVFLIIVCAPVSIAHTQNRDPANDQLPPAAFVKSSSDPAGSHSLESNINNQDAPGIQLPDQPVDVLPGQFQSSQNDQAGAGIGSDFFGLQDNFEDGLIIRSGNVAMKVGGYLKVDLIQDFNPIGSTDLFNVSSIEIGAAPRDNTRFHARQTRLNWDTRWNSDCGPVRLFIEGDFFFNQAETASLGTDRFRLRHAYVQYGKWTVGQTWTTFSDIAASPTTLDFEGQVASVATRRTQIRWTQDIEGTDWSIALAIEDPFTIVDIPTGVGSPRTETPDTVVRLRWSRPNYQLQIAGVTRQLGFQPNGFPVISDQAGGLNFSQVLELVERTKFYSEILYGQGIASFLGGPDVIATGPMTTEINQSLGWMVGGTHQWTDQLWSNLTYAENRYQNIVGIPSDSLNNTTYFAVNLMYSPTERFEYGIEYLYGQRENADGQSQNANRIQAALIVYLK